MLCGCGCGQETKIILRSDVSRDRVHGQHYKFIHGHNPFKGGRTTDPKGYIRIFSPDHPQAQSKGYILEHRIVAEKALGRPIPEMASIHHYGLKTENQKIILCQDFSYHKLLHQRTTAYMACGHANWRKCQFCKDWDDPTNMYVHGKTARHQHCHNQYRKERRHREEGSV